MWYIIIIIKIYVIYYHYYDSKQRNHLQKFLLLETQFSANIYLLSEKGVNLQRPRSVGTSTKIYETFSATCPSEHQTECIKIQDSSELWQQNLNIILQPIRNNQPREISEFLFQAFCVVQLELLEPWTWSILTITMIDTILMIIFDCGVKPCIDHPIEKQSRLFKAGWSGHLLKAYKPHPPRK